MIVGDCGPFLLRSNNRPHLVPAYGLDLLRSGAYGGLAKAGSRRGSEFLFASSTTQWGLRHPPSGQT